MKASAVFLFVLFAFTGILVSASTFVTDHVAHVDALHVQEQITQVIELLQEQNSGTARIIELLLEEHNALSARASLPITDDDDRDGRRPTSYKQDFALELARIANATEATEQNTKVAVGLAWWGGLLGDGGRQRDGDHSGHQPGLAPRREEEAEQGYVNSLQL